MVIFLSNKKRACISKVSINRHLSLFLFLFPFFFNLPENYIAKSHRHVQFVCKRSVHVHQRQGDSRYPRANGFPLIGILTGSRTKSFVCVCVCVYARIIDLYDDDDYEDAGVSYKSSSYSVWCGCESSSVRSSERLRAVLRRSTPTLVMRAIYSLQSGPRFKFERDTAPSPVPSYSNRIFQEQFSITTQWY